MLRDEAESIRNKVSRSNRILCERYERRWSRIFETSAFSVSCDDFGKIKELTTVSIFEKPWLDTVSVRSPNDYLNQLDLYEIVRFVMEARYARLKRVDSTASNHYGLESLFKLASQFSGFDQDYAYLTIAELAYNAPPDDILPFYNRMIDTIWDHHGSLAVREELERRESIASRRRSGVESSNFVLPDSNNKIRNLTDFNGKVVLIHFWGTWCGPCLRQLPRVSDFERNHLTDSNLVCINIAIENRNFETWKKFVGEHNLPGFNLYSEGLWHSTAAEQYGVDVVPSNVIIDRHGNIVGSLIGSAIKDDAIQKEIDIAERQ